MTGVNSSPACAVCGRADGSFAVAILTLFVLLVIVIAVFS